MQLTSIRTDKLDLLPAFTHDGLSPGLTVFFGRQESGTMLVRLVREMLTTTHAQTRYTFSSLPATTGELKLTSGNRIRRVQRSWSAQSGEVISVLDEFDREVAASDRRLLPSWITEDVFREVFSPGTEEASRFDLLTRLCLETTGHPFGSGGDLRHAELALQQAIRDRDGNGVDGGVVHRISELRRRQGELQSEISILRRPAADLPAKIERLIREIEARAIAIERMDARLVEIDAEILRLEQMLIELRRRNVLPLDRQQLEATIAGLTTRRLRWQEIHNLIASERNGLRTTTTAAPVNELLPSLRALTSRLEQRVDSYESTQAAVLSGTGAWAHDGAAFEHFRGELAALCQYLGRHEAATEQHLESLQSLLTDRSLAAVSEVEHMLEEQLAGLRSELRRAGNVLESAAIPANAGDCRFTGHRTLGATLSGSITDHRSVAEVESALAALRTEQSRLLADRSVQHESCAMQRVELERLRQELTGTASLEQFDGLRSSIAGLDAEIAVLEDQRRLLDRSEASLKDVCERLRHHTAPVVLQLASLMAARLTAGEVRGLMAVEPDRLMVRTSQGTEPVTSGRFTRTTRDQIALAMRLALITLRAEHTEWIPFFIDDVFVTGSDERSIAAAELLLELSRAGRQILLVTSSSEVRDWFRRAGTDVRELRIERPEAVLVPPAPVVLHAWVEPTVEVRPMLPEPMPQTVVTVAPPVIVEQTPLVAATNWLFYLEVDHGVEDLAGITLGELEALRSSGILTIDDLLQRTVPQLEEQTRLKGFTVAVERLQALRGQAELTTRVPMLRRGDAALLFAAGIQSTEELSRLRPETVYDRITEFQRSDAGARFRRGGRLIDRQQSINWARFGQFARTLDEARQERSRFSPRPAARTMPPTRPALENVEAASGEPAAAAEPTGLRRRRRRRTEDLNTEERRARRLTRRRRLAARLRSEPASGGSDEEAVVADRNGGMRFFLSRTSAIEKSPSIGPRTAQLLEAIGIRTVEDLLSMPAERLAEKLNHGRMTAPIIQQWQAQSRLMCRIPELRGHDAQILVACGITTPEALAGQQPPELLSVVEPFSRSRDGERIIRNGRRPDLAEVTEWIQWAANARALRAA